MKSSTRHMESVTNITNEWVKLSHRRKKSSILQNERMKNLQPSFHADPSFPFRYPIPFRTAIQVDGADWISRNRLNNVILPGPPAVKP